MDETAQNLEAAATADAIQLLIDTAAIRRLLAGCCQWLDDGHFEEWASLYTEDCRFAVMGRRTQGRTEMRAMIEPFQTEELRGKHLISEPRINLHGDDANATTDFAFVAKDNKILQTGRYYDVLRRGADGWQVAGREIVFTGDEPIGLPD
ncbi:MAG: nuclear transport factor 2 family protein [Acidimicrobiaceae bacterium]|nr:nuclear transport factor 2 family protein [Acidimicrobiaceae bacterium]MDE0493102.1 nuclear transport factor 2 family protein [Acidimicrobiaceae bacterium]MDE0666679.1 nuclear transport factor 2 family protein [Acidimicrobiaceae bacterium]MXW88931.1 nuclear transport factor 2 family protein [Acidimicrobiaceae bacterium]MXY10178.1 nuclear transport factor 2 family protein [Acidimicrobiaceae bacterium]